MTEPDDLARLLTQIADDLLDAAQLAIDCHEPGKHHRNHELAQIHPHMP